MLITGVFLCCTSKRSSVSHTVCSVCVDEVWVSVGGAVFFVSSVAVPVSARVNDPQSLFVYLFQTNVKQRTHQISLRRDITTRRG